MMPFLKRIMLRSTQDLVGCRRGDELTSAMLLELDRRTQRVDVAVAESYRRGYRRPTQASPLYSPVPSPTAGIVRLGASNTVGASGEAGPAQLLKG
jgi:hypothetical protein